MPWPAVENQTLKTATQRNTLDNCKHVFDRIRRRVRPGGNEEIFDRLMNDPAFRDTAPDHLMKEVYESIRNSEIKRTKHKMAFCRDDDAYGKYNVISLP